MILRRALLGFALVATPALAQQQSAGYKFLEAVRKADNQTVVATIESPGQTVINTRDITSGEAALHIVVKRGDAAYLDYLLLRGADPNIRDARGNTPMMLAVEHNDPGAVERLARAKANANLANASGETPLIRAVQRRDLPLVRAVLSAGGDPDQTDNVAGMSARDYAKADDRAPAVANLLAETPKKARRAVAGPTLR